MTNVPGIFCTGDMVSLLQGVSAWPSITPPASPCKIPYTMIHVPLTLNDGLYNTAILPETKEEGWANYCIAFIWHTKSDCLKSMWECLKMCGRQQHSYKLLLCAVLKWSWYYYDYNRGVGAHSCIMGNQGKTEGN